MSKMAMIPKNSLRMFLGFIIVLCVVFFSVSISGFEKTYTNTLGMEFVLIPSGTFTMGSSPNEPYRGSSEVRHKVTISKPFYMQATEVTVKQWHSIMGRRMMVSQKGADNMPVARVSWFDCMKFIKRLNRLGQGKYRLPTEAEWEYACRAGSTTAFPNGGITKLQCDRDDNLDTIGWYCGNSNNMIQPVARKKPNAWGLYDMLGNVQEWCQDWFGVYPDDEVVNPKGPKKGSYRVMRGGAWYSPARDARCASRFGSPPHYRFQHIGFRLGMTL